MPPLLPLQLLLLLPLVAPYTVCVATPHVIPDQLVSSAASRGVLGSPPPCSPLLLSLPSPLPTPLLRMLQRLTAKLDREERNKRLTRQGQRQDVVFWAARGKRPYACCRHPLVHRYWDEAARPGLVTYGTLRRLLGLPQKRAPEQHIRSDNRHADVDDRDVGSAADEPAWLTLADDEDDAVIEVGSETTRGSVENRAVSEIKGRDVTLLPSQLKRDKAVAEEKKEFWASRGKKNDREVRTDFWASRGKKDDDFWASRGKKDKTLVRSAQASQIELLRAKRDPFWASRGK